MRDEEITVAKCLTLENPLFIDLRSPSEYQEATIPGAINLPFFNDQKGPRSALFTGSKVPARHGLGAWS